MTLLISSLSRSFLFLLLMVVPLQALVAPPLKGRVNDYAGMLSAPAASALESKLAAFERDNGTQIAVLTIPSLEGDSIDGFAIQVAEAWKIGQKGKDNGVILVVAKKERKIRIEVGMGLQGSLPDITAGQIIRNVMAPHMKAGNVDKGVESGVEAIIQAVKGEFKAPAKSEKRKAGRKAPSMITGAVIGAALLALVMGAFSGKLGGAAGAIGLPLAGFMSIPGIGWGVLLALLAAGLFIGMLVALLKSGGGGYYGGGWGGGYYGGGGSSGGGDSFSGGGGEFDGGGASDDY